MNENNNENIFINGKQQIIEMLRFMNTSERNKLLGNIKARNATMAKELSEQSFSFNDLYLLNPTQLKILFSQSNPIILGLALYLAPVEFQRKVLGILDRSKAEKAFETLAQNLDHKKIECRKAQQKILSEAIYMSQRGLVSLS